MSFLLKFVRANALVSLPSTTALLNPNRSFVSRKTALIEKKLGMPARPKRPLMPFIRFSMEMRATQNFANRNAADVFVDLGALWKNADDAKKAIYKLEYQKEWGKYKEELEEYESKITEEQAEQLEFEKQLLEIEMQNKDKKKKKNGRRNVFGKPKRPLSAYLLFLNECREKSSEKITLADVSPKWAALNKSERAVYIENAAILSENYRRALKEWQQNLLENDNVDVARKKKSE